MDTIEVYTDGACRCNGSENAIGGWAYMYCYRNGSSSCTTRNYAHEFGTTNNKMELTAILEALRDLNEHNFTAYKLAIYSDSAYAIGCCSVWSESWKKRGWKKAGGAEILNLDIIKEIDSLIQKFESVKFIKVKGHSDDSKNDEVDYYCNKAMDEGLAKLK